jgi:hypothetical protein
MKKYYFLVFFFLYTYVHAATVTVYSSTSDGWVGYSHSTWSTARSAATGSSAVDNESYSSTSNASAYLFSGTYYINRGFLYFNLAAYPTGVVKSVTLKIARRDTTFTNSYISAQKGTQADPLTTADFDSFTGSEYGHTGAFGSPDDENYRSITFNAQGIADVQAALGGVVKICLREYSQDYSNVTPSAAGCYVNDIYYSNNTGTSKDPYLEFDLVPSIKGTLKEKESDASGKAYGYFILDVAAHNLQAQGAAASDGTWEQEVDNTTAEYCGVVYDAVGGAVYSGDYGTDTTSSGSWSITNADWADGDTVWAFFVDPQKVYKTIGAKFTANSSHAISGTHKENGTNATGTKVFAFGFGTTSGTYNPKPFFDFATGQ